jgi:hypothetical protein
MRHTPAVLSFIEHMAEEQLTVLPESNENHGLFFIFPVAY